MRRGVGQVARIGARAAPPPPWYAPTRGAGDPVLRPSRERGWPRRPLIRSPPAGPARRGRAGRPTRAAGRRRARFECFPPLRLVVQRQPAPVQREPPRAAEDHDLGGPRRPPRYAPQQRRGGVEGEQVAGEAAHRRASYHTDDTWPRGSLTWWVVHRTAFFRGQHVESTGLAWRGAHVVPRHLNDPPRPPRQRNNTKGDKAERADADDGVNEYEAEPFEGVGWHDRASYPPASAESSGRAP